LPEIVREFVRLACPRGAYHFFWPLASATEQAEHFIETVGNLQPGDLPPGLNLDEAVLQQSPQQDVWTAVPLDNRFPMSHPMPLRSGNLDRGRFSETQKDCSI
jgi:hypothetical protein